MILSTITPYWGRPEMLRGWVKAMRGASAPGVCHIVLFVGCFPPGWWHSEVRGTSIFSVTEYVQGEPHSIGHYHNRIAEDTNLSEWIMKIDIDTLPSPKFFHSLLSVLSKAEPKAWFNAGMFYINAASTAALLNDSKLPLSDRDFEQFKNGSAHTVGPYTPLPQGTNFICRRQDYLDHARCLSEFKGWGWEDYQQIYDLEFFQRGEDPLPGDVTLGNVTGRCRDEISRKKASELWRLDKNLCLLHRAHSPAGNKNLVQSNLNKLVLFNHIRKRKGLRAQTH